MAYCNLPEKFAGPYNQVLFLGCSISNFNCNLGWGAEQSTLNVSLVSDNCSHPDSSKYNAFNTRIDTIIQQDDNVAGGNAFNKNSAGSYVTDDPTKALHKNMAFELKKLESSRDEENIALPQDFQDNGKICYDNEGNIVYWKDPDPVFVASTGNKFKDKGIDILGVPVRFKFNNFTFGGMVSSWKENGSQGGSGIVDVEIKSFASLLNGCQLIVGKYAGTVCGIVSNTSNNPANVNLAAPMPYSIDDSTTPPTFTFLPHDATIKQGNIPNVFNIYGYVEYLGYSNGVYGAAQLTEEGMRATYIYDSLNALLSPSTDIKSAFSPYGGIVCRTIRENETAAEIDPTTATISSVGGSSISLIHMGLCPNVMLYNNRRSILKLDLSEVPRPPKWLRIQGPVISLMQFITEICDGTGYDFFVDFQPAPADSSSFSGIIKIRTVSRRKQPKKDQIGKLIETLTRNYGVSSYTKGKEFTDTNTRTMYIGGKQKRLLQLKCTRLAFKQNALIYDPYANNGDGSLIDYNNLGSFASMPNKVRMPNVLSTRRYSVKYSGGAAVMSDSSNVNNSTYFGTGEDSNSIRRGNYEESIELGEAQGFLGSMGTIGDNIELYKDTICPYFGVGSNNLIRPVYFDKKMGQMQIIFPMSDIQNLTSLPLSNYNPYNAAGAALGTSSSSPIFLVLENELRAAGGGFKAWLDYCFAGVFTTDISEILYKGFRDKYGFGPSSSSSAAMFNNMFADFVTGIGAIMMKTGAKAKIVNSRPMQVSLDDLSIEFQSLYADLERIHSFFEKIAQEYYGKQFMVKIPRLAFYRDLTYSMPKTSLYTDEYNNDIYAFEGTGKVYTNYSISTDGAWEEPGNFIDDTIVVGGLRASSMCDESGKIPCILGFNASCERDHSRRLLRAQFLNSVVRKDLGGGFNQIDWELALHHMYKDPVLNNSHDYLSLRHELPATEYVFLPYSTSINILSAHSGPVRSDCKYKMYAKATPSSDIQFLSPNYTDPRAIITLSAPVFVGADKHATDYNIDAIKVQDGLLYLNLGFSVPSVLSQSVGATLDTSINNGLGRNPLLPTFSNFFMRSLQQQHIMSIVIDNTNPRNSTIDTDKVLPKAASPIFCALPIEFNDFIYGPWINYPGLIAANIFPGATDEGVRDLELENLVGGVKVNVDESLVPWNYGGMLALDEAVMLKIADEVNYQQVLEMGTLQIPGFDNFSLGDMIQYYGNLYSGPIISSIQVQIADNGITSTYNFRTYLRKLGLFNKENSDRIKAIAQEAIKRNKEISTQIMNIKSKFNNIARIL